MSRTSVLALAAGVAMALACGNPSGEGNGCQGTGAAHIIDAQDSKTFSPALLTISASTSVCWQNTGTISHTMTATSSSPLDSSWIVDSVNVQLNPGSLYFRSFGKVGNYLYHCSLHPGMTGEVDVR